MHVMSQFEAFYIECTLRTHCPIYHSKVHMIVQCEYNLLNKVAALVRQIRPQDDHHVDRHQLAQWV